MKTNTKNQSGSALVIIVLIAVVVAIAGVLWFVFTRNNNDDSANNNGDEASQVATTTFEGTMFDALRLTDGKTLECDWTLNYEGEALISEGKIYTTGNDLIRSTATFESEGETRESNSVIGKGEIYDWYDNDSESTAKTPLSAIEGQPPMEDAYARSGQIDPNATFNFVCQEWELDNAMYEIPIPLSQLPGQGQ